MSYGRSAVNLGAGAPDAYYMQEGGDPFGMPLTETSPGSVPEYLYDLQVSGESPLPDGTFVENPEDLESGLSSVIYDRLMGDNVTRDVRESARVGGTRTEALYGSDPSFMQTLIEEYNYPAVFDEELGELVIPTDRTEFTEAERHARPGGEKYLPTYPELEDARAHMLGTALTSAEYGPETAMKAGNFGEFMDRFAPFPFGGQNAEDVAMDKRNNAVGAILFKQAGINATPEQLTRMVDAEVFKQLEKIMGRPEDERSFTSPRGGPDLFFNRDERGFFDTTRNILGAGRPYRY